VKKRFPYNYALGLLIVPLLAAISANAAEQDRHKESFVVTSTNDANTNQVIVFRLDTAGTTSLKLVNTLSTGGKGGAGGNAGAVQFRNSFGRGGELRFEQRSAPGTRRRCDPNLRHFPPCIRLHSAGIGRSE
jgi:hypothetical protein